MKKLSSKRILPINPELTRQGVSNKNNKILYYKFFTLNYTQYTVDIFRMAPVRSHRSHRHGARGLGDLDISSSGSSLRSKSSTDSDDVSVKILTPVNDEWEKNYSEFDSSFPTQVKCIVWRIKDFSTLLQLKGASGKEEIEFTGGEEVSMPSKWKMSLMFDGDKIGLYLSLVEYTGTERTVFAKFESKIKHPCGTKELISRSVQPTDMKAVEDWGWGSFTSVPSIKNSGVLVRDRLTIHLRLEFYGKTVRNNYRLIDLIKLHMN